MEILLAKYSCQSSMGNEVQGLHVGHLPSSPTTIRSPLDPCEGTWIFLFGGTGATCAAAKWATWSSLLSEETQVEMKNVVVIILIIFVAVEAYATSPPSRKRRIIAADLSLAVAMILANRDWWAVSIQPINDKNGATTCGVTQNSNLEMGTRSAEFKILLCYWLKKFFVSRPIGTQDSKVDTRKTRF